MKSFELSNMLVDVADRPFGTVADAVAALQASGKMLKGRRGRHGGVELRTACKINALLATALDHPRGIPLSDSVDAVCRLELMVARRTNGLDELPLEGARGAFDFLRGLSIHPLDIFGETLVGLLGDIESGAFAKWAGDDKINVTIDIYNRGRGALLSIDRWNLRQGAYLAFGPQESSEDKSRVNRLVRLDLKIFKRLAGDDTT